MGASTTAAPPTPEATYKAREFEGVLDLYFYRKVGFQLARFFAWLRFTPIGVTLVGGIFGLAAGHLYYYRDLRLNLLGMVLHVIANALDNADGQLARLTNTSSRRGRIVDSVVDHTIFIGIYLHLTLRCWHGGDGAWIWLLALVAGMSHAWQAAAADYSRNAYLHFAKAQGRAHFENYDDLREEYDRMRWRDRPIDKFFFGIYLNGTRQQEVMAPDMRRLHETVTREFDDVIPSWWQLQYRRLVGPSFRLWGFLMTNTRMLILFALLILNQPAWFFWIELTGFNLLFAFLILQQARTSRWLIELVTAPPESA